MLDFLNPRLMTVSIDHDRYLPLEFREGKRLLARARFNHTTSDLHGLAHRSHATLPGHVPEGRRSPQTHVVSSLSRYVW